MQIDEHGTKLDCFSYNCQKGGYKASCRILRDWYNSDKNNRCGKCPFYKTHEQLQRELAGDFS